MLEFMQLEDQEINPVSYWFGGRDYYFDINGEIVPIPKRYDFEKTFFRSQDLKIRAVCRIQFFLDLKFYVANLEVNCKPVLERIRENLRTSMKAVLQELDIYLEDNRLITKALGEFYRKDHWGILASENKEELLSFREFNNIPNNYLGDFVYRNYSGGDWKSIRKFIGGYSGVI